MNWPPDIPDKVCSTTS